METAYKKPLDGGYLLMRSKRKRAPNGGFETRIPAPLQEPPQKEDGWRFYIIADLKTWADNAENRSPLEHFDSFDAAKARFDELRSMAYNSETTEPSPDSQPPAHLTLGLERADGISAADILHVRQGKNYLVTDFIRMKRLRKRLLC